jgi:hypothetical protein
MHTPLPGPELISAADAVEAENAETTAMPAASANVLANFVNMSKYPFITRADFFPCPVQARNMP